MEEVNQCHYWLSSPTVTGQTAVSPIQPPRLQQGSATAVSHTSRTEWASLYRVGTVASLFNRRRSPVTHVKTLCPLETIKGEPGLISSTHNQDHAHNTHAYTRVASSTLSTTQSRDMGLSPLSQTACTPLLQVPLGARQYRLPISHWT